MKYHEPIPTYLIVLDRIEESTHTKFYVLLKKGQIQGGTRVGRGQGQGGKVPPSMYVSLTPASITNIVCVQLRNYYDDSDHDFVQMMISTL